MKNLLKNDFGVFGVLKKKSFVQKKIFSIITVCSILFGYVSCASSPKVVSETSKAVYEAQSSAQEQEKTAIKSKEKDSVKTKSYTYFSHIPSEILADVENGSPSALRKAISALRKSSSEYDEAEKVLLSVCKEIMQLCWPTERVDWEIPDVSSENSYLGAIKSAKNGIYDTSTGNVDFLTTVLPSLVVLRSDDVSSYFSIAREALESGLKMQPNSVLANYLLGTLFKKNKMYESAIPYFQKAFSLAPECIQVAYENANCQYLSGNLKVANELSLSLLQKYPSNPRVLDLCACIAFDLKDFSSAEEYIAKVLQQEPNNLQALLFRVKILMEKKDYIHAAALLDIYSRQDSSSKDYLLLRARLQSDWSRNTTAAISTIETALNKFPQDSEILMFAARLAGITMGEVGGKTVAQYAQQVLEKDPENEEALHLAIEGLVQNQQWNQAYELSSKLLQKNPENDFEVISLHIKICLNLQKGEEAWNLIFPIYRNNSSNEDVIQDYILVLSATGRTQQTLSLINQLLPESSTRLKSFLYYRRSFLQTQEEDSLSDLRSSLIAYSRNSDALFRLYEIYYSKKDYKRAQYYLKQVVGLNPNDAHLRSLNEELSNLLKM